LVGGDEVVVGEDGVAGEGGGVLTGGLLHSTGGISCLPSTVVSSSLLFSPDGASPVGGFALPEVYSVPEVVVVALELDGLALGAVGAPPFVEAAFLTAPSLLSATRPIRNWVCDATARALLSASWALTMGGPFLLHPD